MARLLADYETRFGRGEPVMGFNQGEYIQFVRNYLPHDSLTLAGDP
jgi:hypothetical protein